MTHLIINHKKHIVNRTCIFIYLIIKLSFIDPLKNKNVYLKK